VREIPPVVLVPLLLVIVLQLYLVEWGCRARGGDDFGKLYHGVRQGDLYRPTPGTTWFDIGGERVTLVNLNPPHVSLLVVPLARLPLLPALRLWMLGQLACAVLICAISVRRG
jgi:hypothetical protein